MSHQLTRSSVILLPFFAFTFFFFFLFFEGGRVIANKDLAAHVYYLYVSVIKTELPNSSEEQNCPGNEYRNCFFFGCQLSLVFYHTFSIIHNVI